MTDSTGPMGVGNGKDEVSQEIAEQEILPKYEQEHPYGVREQLARAEQFGKELSHRAREDARQDEADRAKTSGIYFGA